MRNINKMLAFCILSRYTQTHNDYKEGNRRLCSDYPSNDHHFSLRGSRQTSGQCQMSAHQGRFSFTRLRSWPDFLFLDILVCAVYGHTTARFLARTVIHGYRARDYSPICARFKACCNSRSNGHVTALQCSYVRQYAQPGDALK